MQGLQREKYVGFLKRSYKGVSIKDIIIIMSLIILMGVDIGNSGGAVNSLKIFLIVLTLGYSFAKIELHSPYISIIIAVAHIVYSYVAYFIRGYRNIDVMMMVMIQVISFTIAINRGSTRGQLKKQIKQLEERQRNLEHAEATSNVIVVYTDLEGTFTKVPPGFCKIMGYTEAELLNKNYKEITHGEDLQISVENTDSLIRGEKTAIKMDKRYIRKDGQIIWVDLNESVARDHYGNPCYLLAYIRDITEEKRMKNALEESEMKLRRITDNISDMIVETTMDGIIRYASPSNKVSTGYEVEEMIGESILEKMHPDDIDKVKITMEKLKEDLTWSKVEVRCQHRQGHYAWIEIMGNVLIGDNDGASGLIFCARDISERKKVEMDLYESEERYRSLFENSPDAISVYNDEKFILANRAAAKLVGLKDPKQLIGRSVMDFIHSSSYEKKLEATEEIKIGKVEPGYFTEEKIVDIYGRVIDVEVGCSLLSYNGRMAVQVVSRDISDRKRAEILEKHMAQKQQLIHEMQECDRLKTEFFSNISHELRTPLNVILGSLQLMNLYTNKEASMTYPNNLSKHVGIMRQNSYRLLRLVNNLIDMTKIDSGFCEMQLQNHNIVSIVEEITLSVAAFIENRQITLLFDTEVEERMIACDPDKIERIILNLLSNSVKFTNYGGQITVYIEEIEGNVVISIKDTGIGIETEKLDMIFQRFRQADDLLTRRNEGSGIGLSLAKSLIELQGGTISVTSEYGRGSEFTVTFPIRVVETMKGEVQEINNKQKSYIEQISIEFSDIYALN
ncbi:multi-sensor signal transduction histidine kinase [Alkaliphilus metalliredigens QYMF]|uniref:histidine kinase n=1 Tax=Alkaliphilus metalliredigens (strain QYMF) TaxID=293826 RepID=A6TWB2_ALKMQ|nr:PAS domain-containing sensor histidine kinase [Alkaliphilus metalliredigens]ABR50480.1 multi-sensor signal transduction histidine kinase [Alkaliphilus metalliredigens QYMF]